MDKIMYNKINDILSEYNERFSYFSLEYFQDVATDKKTIEEGFDISENEKLMVKDGKNWDDKFETYEWTPKFWIESKDGRKIRDIDMREAEYIIVRQSYTMITFEFAKESQTVLDKLSRFGHWAEDYVLAEKQRHEEYRIYLKDLIKKAEENPAERDNLYDEYKKEGQSCLDYQQVFVLYWSVRFLNPIFMASMWNSNYEVSGEIIKAGRDLSQFFKDELKKANLPEKYIKKLNSLEKDNYGSLLKTKEKESEEYDRR